MVSKWVGGFIVAGAVAGGCVKPQVVVCDDGTVCPQGNVCIGAEPHSICVLPEQIEACASAENGEACAAEGAPDGLCRDSVCFPAGCGDGFRVDPEECDGEEFLLANCTDLGYYDSRALGCNTACGYDVRECTGYCLDGVVNGAEFCDDRVGPPIESCVDLGYAAGFLECSMCGPGLEDCKFLGWRSTMTSLVAADIHGTSDDDVFLVGDTSEILHYNGKAWLPFDAGTDCVPAGADYEYTSVWMYAPGAAVVVGHDKNGGGPPNPSFALHIAGTTCTKTQIATTEGVQAVWATAANNIYVAGDNGIGVRHYNGTAWTQIYDGDLVAIYGVGPSDIYAAGDGVGLLRSTGGAFTPVSNATFTGAIRDIWGDAATNLFFATMQTDLSTVQVWRYDGAWSEILSAGTSSIRGTYANGRSFIAYNGRAYSWVGGTDWLDLQLPSLGLGAGRESYLPIFAASSGRVYAGANLRAHYYFGSAWHETASLLPGNTFSAGGPNYAALNFGNNFHVFDGQAWTVDLDAPTSLGDLWIDDSTGDIYAISGTDGLRRRAQTDPTWATVLATNGHVLWGVSPTDLWIATNTEEQDEAQLTHWLDSGTSCTTPDCVAPYAITGFWGSASNDVYAVGNGRLRHWNGSAWSEIPGVLAEDTKASIHGTAANDVYIGSSDGVLHHWNGTTWTTPVTFPFSVTAVYAFAPNDVFVGGTNGNLRHYDGSHWYPVRYEYLEVISTLEGSGDVLFVGDRGGRVHRLIRSARW